MASVIDVDSQVLQNQAAEHAFEAADEKPRLGSSREFAYVFPNTEGTFRILEGFDRSALMKIDFDDLSGNGAPQDFDLSSVLLSACLNEFVDLVSKWKGVDSFLIEAFVNSYSAPERKSSVRGHQVSATAESIADILKLPDSGTNFKALSLDKSIVVDNCFLPHYCPSKSAAVHIEISDVHPRWRPWLELVQVYLLVQPKTSFVDMESLRAAVAIRQGVRINWSLAVSRSIHNCLLEFKAAPAVLHCAYHIHTLCRAVCPAFPVPLPLPTVVKPDPEDSTKKKVESSSVINVESSSFPSAVNPVLSQRVLTNFHIWMARGGDDYENAQLHIVQNANADLKTQMGALRTQLEKQSRRTISAELEVSRLREKSEEDDSRVQEVEQYLRVKQCDHSASQTVLKKYKERATATDLELNQWKMKCAELEQKSVKDNEKFLELHCQYNMEKESRQTLEQWKRLAENELGTLRKFYSDFSYLKAPEENEMSADFMDDVEFCNAGFVGDLPLTVSFRSLKELEDILPPSSNIEDAYVWERQIFFIHTGLTLKEFVTELRFHFLWKKAGLLGSEDLFTEIIVRGDVVLEDPSGASFPIIADYGARILKWHAHLEEKLAIRRERYTTRSAKQRKLEGHWLSTSVEEYRSTFEESSAAASMTVFREFQNRLVALDEEFASEAWMHDLLRNCQSRITGSQKIDVHPATYLKSYHAVKARVKAKSSAKCMSELPRISIDAEAGLTMPYVDEKVDPLSGTFTNFATWLPPLPNSVQALDNYYLGMWPHLFSELAPQPFPTWEAIAWIVKDHSHIHRIPRVPLGKYESNNRSRRSSVPPISVRNDPRYCPCPRRYSWSSDAKLDSVYYNWPIILGDFDTPKLCAESYSRFSEEHRHHQDSVCFRASIFAAVLAFWCEEGGITVDYRVGSRFSTDMVVYNSILYHSSRRIRMLEIMCQMQFLRDGHDCMIGDCSQETGTRETPAFLCLTKHEMYKEKRRENAAQLKAEEAIWMNSYNAELARVTGKGKENKTEY